MHIAYTTLHLLFWSNLPFSPPIFSLKSFLIVEIIEQILFNKNVLNLYLKKYLTKLTHNQLYNFHLNISMKLLLLFLNLNVTAYIGKIIFLIILFQLTRFLTDAHLVVFFYNFLNTTLNKFNFIIGKFKLKDLKKKNLNILFGLTSYL